MQTRTPLSVHRFAAGLTQKQLADRAQVTRETVVALEHGRHSPRRLTADALSAALGVPAEELFPAADWPEIEPITGAEAAWDFYVAADDAWEPGPYEFDDASAVGDQVVGHLRREARGKASGAAVSYSYWIVVTFHDTRVRRIEWFTGRTEALEAVGLSEQDAHADS